MNKQFGKVADIHHPQSAAGSNGNSNGNGSRLVAIEARLTTLETRLTALETRIEYLATKEDIQAMQLTMLKWGVSILAFSLISVVGMAFRFTAG